MIIPLLLGLFLVVAVGASRSMAEPGTPPRPEISPELDPVTLERKRLMIKYGFQLAVDKRRAFIASQRITEPFQKSKDIVAIYLREAGIPLGPPDPGVPFWSRTEREMANYLTEAIDRFLPPKVV